MDERNRLILEEARAALSQQRDDLNKIRDRASGLLSAGGLVATFFGSLALRDHVTQLSGWIYAAAAMVVALAAGTIYINSPRVFIFSNDPQIMLQGWSLDIDADDWVRQFAEHLDTNCTKNRKKITPLTWVYLAALLAFAAEVTFLGVDLALR